MAREPLAQRVRDRLAVGRVGHDQEALVGDAVDDQVVDDPAVVGADHAVVRAAVGEPRRVADQRGGEPGRRRPGPLTQTSPMCDRSNSPARSRTARCSSRMPAYWTGISQPAKSISRAAERAVSLDQRGLEQLAAVGCVRAVESASCVDSGRRQRLLDDLALGREAHQLARLVDRHPADLVELVVVVVQAAAGRLPSGSSGRSCGCASPCWVKKYSMAPTGATMRTSSPVSSATSRSAVSSTVSPSSGVPLGSVQLEPSRSRRRRPRQISSPQSVSRMTTPPHDVARAVRAPGGCGPVAPCLSAAPRRGAARARPARSAVGCGRDQVIGVGAAQRPRRTAPGRTGSAAAARGSRMATQRRRAASVSTGGLRPGECGADRRPAQGALAAVPDAAAANRVVGPVASDAGLTDAHRIGMVAARGRPAMRRRIGSIDLDSAVVQRAAVELRRAAPSSSSPRRRAMASSRRATST